MILSAIAAAAFSASSFVEESSFESAGGGTGEGDVYSSSINGLG